MIAHLCRSWSGQGWKKKVEKLLPIMQRASHNHCAFLQPQLNEGSRIYWNYLSRSMPRVLTVFRGQSKQSETSESEIWICPKRKLPVALLDLRLCLFLEDAGRLMATLEILINFET
jgi:hypothetical protein